MYVHKTRGQGCRDRFFLACDIPSTFQRASTRLNPSSQLIPSFFRLPGGRGMVSGNTNEEERADESKPHSVRNVSVSDLFRVLTRKRKFSPPNSLYPHPAIYTPQEENIATVIVDVRSPCEYTYAHVPGAFNVPLFTDAERAEVGTLYKAAGKRQALLRGLELAGPKFASMLTKVEELFKSAKKKSQAKGKKRSLANFSTNLKKERELIVYCARGGMRSRCMSFLFSLPDSDLPVKVLTGGYKAWRNGVLSKLMEPRNVIVLGGLTGSGKTAVLHELAAMGEQVIDLEGWCHHKGSAFGGLGETQPGSPEMVENGLAVEWEALDRERHVWLEDESRHIGGLFLPPKVFELIRNSQVIKIQIPQNQRKQHLFETYCKYDKEDIKACLKNITKRLGTERTNKALALLDNGDLMPVLEDVLKYYDTTYTGGLSQRRPDSVHTLELPEGSSAKHAAAVLAYFNKYVKR